VSGNFPDKRANLCPPLPPPPKKKPTPICFISIKNKIADFSNLINHHIFAANGYIWKQTSVVGFLQHALPNKYMILAIVDFDAKIMASFSR
jgi:hypothetical protein